MQEVISLEKQRRMELCRALWFTLVISNWYNDYVIYYFTSFIDTKGNNSRIHSIIALSLKKRNIFNNNINEYKPIQIRR